MLLSILANYHFFSYAISKDKSVKMIVAEAIDQFQKAKDNYTQVAKQCTLHEDRAQYVFHPFILRNRLFKMIFSHFLKCKFPNTSSPTLFYNAIIAQWI